MTNYRRKKKTNQTKTDLKYYVNEKIFDPKVRVITESGENLGIMNTKDAIQTAKDQGLDLVKINPKADPPIAKIMDWNKFKYIQSKNEKAKIKKEKKLKTIRVSVRIGPHDLSVQAKKCDQFLEKGHQIKLQVVMKGREKAHPEIAEEVMQDLLKLIQFPFETLGEPKKTGDSFYSTIQPAPGSRPSVKKTKPTDEDLDEEVEREEDNKEENLEDTKKKV
jgi:translation initiation factor IF-3